MFQIEVDKHKKLIKIKFSGHVNIDQIEYDVETIMKELQRFEAGEAAVLALLERMEPVSQEHIPIVMKTLCLMKAHARKIASVHRNVITRMQLGRIEAGIENELYKELQEIQRFRTEKEALEYLFANESFPTQ